ncbi:9481_t:CDS:1 [Acaulospora colombiana]|uniref:9481_t:CDS:1 n=1 Tax=Acaulospora colombiana TaxID=27376 RepID=A0ACA9KMZ9_9GLOM|nr:9481_t:CDS:1 [Acaulospora colombiana]
MVALEMMEDDRALQEDEIFALTSIFGSDSVNLDNQASSRTFNFRLPLESNLSSTFDKRNQSSSANTITLKFRFPHDYPSASPPIYEIASLYCGPLKIDDKMRNEIDERFKELFVPGQVIIFEWVEWLRGFLSQKLAEGQLDETDIHSSQQNLDSYQPEENPNVEEQPSAHTTTIDCPPITSGEPLEHKKSVFVAHLAPVHSIQEVQLVRDTLMLNKKVAKATHNIMAYRIVQGSGVILQGMQI